MMQDDILAVAFHILTAYNDIAHPAVRTCSAVVSHTQAYIPAASAFFSTAAENAIVFMCPGSPFNPDIQSDKRYHVSMDTYMNGRTREKTIAPTHSPLIYSCWVSLSMSILIKR